AADLPRYKAPPPPPPPPPMWTGFYVGLNAGGTWSSSNSVRVGTLPIAQPGADPAVVPQLALLASGSLSSRNNGGFIGGGQIGYNWQFYNSFVGGVEADIQGIARSNNSTNFTTAAVVVGVPVISNTALARSLDYIGTVRGRLGWLFTPTLLAYGTGGLAYGGVNISTSVFQAGTNGFSGFGATSFADTRVGWTVGGGLEWMFWPNWSAKVEYLYYDLGNVSTSGALTSAFFPIATYGITQQTTRFNGNIVRAGVNYHFNWGTAPIVAKY
ncbi:MAG: porin family protein, partial [Alphaproteobacteria bacterium]|nr:porin family protein [Alphaproteobacteria bacterium]